MLAKIWNNSGWIKSTEPDDLDKRYTKMLLDSGFHILGQIEYNFHPQGYTKLWLLGESHFAVHTFPEEGKTYYELSSCNKEYFDKFVKNMKGNEVILWQDQEKR
jgi:S-adenosylmethionine/arginine decarboxylase-like enzyme